MARDDPEGANSGALRSRRVGKRGGAGVDPDQAAGDAAVLGFAGPEGAHPARPPRRIVHRAPSLAFGEQGDRDGVIIMRTTEIKLCTIAAATAVMLALAAGSAAAQPSGPSSGAVGGGIGGGMPAGPGPTMPGAGAGAMPPGAGTGGPGMPGAGSTMPPGAGTGGAAPMGTGPASPPGMPPIPGTPQVPGEPQ